MLHDLISVKVGAWLEREDCPARPIIEHIQTAGFFRDAQIKAVRTYLFLKIKGGNRPLSELLCDGLLLPKEDISRLHISEETRSLFQTDRKAFALFQFSRLKAKDTAKTLLPELERFLLDHAAKVNCDTVVKSLFYGVDYPDYLFSLPMGAGENVPDGGVLKANGAPTPRSKLTRKVSSPAMA